MTHAKKKTAVELDREIAASLAKRSAKARRETASLERRSATDAVDTKWRRDTIDQVRSWVEANRQGPWDERMHNLVIKRLTKLVSFVRSFFPEAGPAPFDPWDAAALIVLPRQQALRLARRLFGGGPGITKELQVEDLSFNTDWFRPKDFH